MCIRFRHFSLGRTFGAYRSQWKRMLMRGLTFGTYGSKGMGWWNDPEKAWYNFWYHRTTIGVDKLLGVKRRDKFFGLFCCAVVCLALIGFDSIAAVSTHAVNVQHEKKERRASQGGSGKGKSTKEGKKRERTDSIASAQLSQEAANKAERTTHPLANGDASEKSSVSSKSDTMPKEKKACPEEKVQEESETPVKTETPCVPDGETVEKTEAGRPMASAAPKKVRQTSAPVFFGREAVERQAESDENTPKSTPRNEKDQYIRKRMTFAESTESNVAVWEQLVVGTYFDVTVDPQNEDEVLLSYNGERLGHIDKENKQIFLACLRMRRRIYGVITDIQTNGERIFEFETWFDYS